MVPHYGLCLEVKFDHANVAFEDERHASPRSRRVMLDLEKRPTRDSGACDCSSKPLSRQDQGIGVGSSANAEKFEIFLRVNTLEGVSPIASDRLYKRSDQ